MKQKQLLRKEERENKRAKASSWGKNNYTLKINFYQLKEQGRDFWARPGKTRGTRCSNKVTEKTEIQEHPRVAALESGW